MRNVTLRQIRVFSAVARNLSFTRAARELHLTQPAVSQQVKLLEQDIGLPLFEHIGRKVQLARRAREGEVARNRAENPDLPQRHVPHP